MNINFRYSKDNHISNIHCSKINTSESFNLSSYINSLGEFLATRDIDNLSVESLYNKYSILNVDILVLLGNAIPYTIGVAYEAYKKGLCNKILVSGGIGHSTHFLRSAIQTNFKFNDVKIDNNSEADIFKDILVNYYNVPEKDIIVESQSTNCGDNALKSVQLLDKLKISYNSILLIQDPTMQLRSYASFAKYLEDKDVKIINYAPFIPTLDNNMLFINKDIDGIWDIDRYLNLIVGEIPRLKDNEKGYGPNGKNFIVHVDIPDYITDNYNKITSFIDNSR
ncbi:YdcF family protein [Clostridium sp. NSJ-145]|uniref:YdcF family protein n=1 Tax=Clostridium sp. NSJ-145 TaxID=2897777 RepID=UPI001E48B20D|nr:YdcF family protein [Clostridium sp. NSJ-145]MCD2501979.1 YdcF family protein [Clostridium sp. NSJ-145]